MSIASHIQYFDRLVDLIPAKYYLADEDAEQINLKYLKKDARAEVKAKFKQEYKKKKLAKLDPDAPSSTLELQRAQDAADKRRAAGGTSADDASDDDDDEEEDDMSEEGEEGSDDEGNGEDGMEVDDGDGEEGPSTGPGSNGFPGLKPQTGAPPSREELKERLQKKLESFRAQRKADEAADKAKQAKEWRDSALQKGRDAAKQKTKQHAPKPKSKPLDAAPSAAAPAATAGGLKPAQQQQQQQTAKKKPAGGGLKFTKVDFGDDADAAKRRARKKTKTELLEVAEKRKEEMSKLEGTEQGQVKVLKQGWGNALARAQGEKVFDDPKLLRKSLKKERQVKTKKSKVWKERVGKQHQEQAARQQKRTDNIQGRIQGKKDKKIKKREKKLLRAGFEGRKSGFIATPKK